MEKNNTRYSKVEEFGKQVMVAKEVEELNEHLEAVHLMKVQRLR